MDEEPIPQPQGQLVPPRRRPPVAVAVLTPDPPERVPGSGTARAQVLSFCQQLVAWLRRLLGRQG